MTEPTRSSPSRAAIMNMKIHRKRRGWSAKRLTEELSAAGGYPTGYNTIASQESGRRCAMSLDQAAGLSSVFAVSLDDLVSPECEQCIGAPPAGFVCKLCGSEG